MHLYPPEVRRGEVLPAVSDDAEAVHVCQAGVHGGKPRQHHVSGSAHSWSALPHVSEGEVMKSSARALCWLLAMKVRNCIPLCSKLSVDSEILKPEILALGKVNRKSLAKCLKVKQGCCFLY